MQLSSHEMAQWVKVTAAKADDWSSTPRAHTVVGEKRLLQIVLSPPCVHGCMCMGVCTYKNT